MNDSENVQFHCEDCYYFNSCKYYGGERKNQKICPNFSLTYLDFKSIKEAEVEISKLQSKIGELKEQLDWIKQALKV